MSGSFSNEGFLFQSKQHWDLVGHEKLHNYEEALLVFSFQPMLLHIQDAAPTAMSKPPGVENWSWTQTV